MSCLSISPQARPMPVTGLGSNVSCQPSMARLTTILLPKSNVCLRTGGLLLAHQAHYYSGLSSLPLFILCFVPTSFTEMFNSFLSLSLSLLFFFKDSWTFEILSVAHKSFVDNVSFVLYYVYSTSFENSCVW